MTNIKEYIIVFFIFSFIGWLMETIKVSLKEKKLVDRGFLLGPYLPIYGFGCILIYLLLHKIDSILIILLLSMVFCSIFEYIVSYIMEKIFQARWWDYSNRKFNISGRVCLTNTILFGVAASILLRYIFPIIINKVLIIPFFTNIYLICFLCIVFITDFVITSKIVWNITRQEKFKADSTVEISNKVVSFIKSKLIEITN